MSTQTTASPLTVQEAIDLWQEVPKRPFSDRARRALAAADSDSLDFEGIPLPVSIWGEESNPLVLLVHGWGGHRAQLSAFAEALAAAGYRAISFDAPGHGDAPGKHTNGYQIAQVIRALVAKFGQPYAIIGHSLGTMSASIALQEGLKTEKLVLTGPMRRLHDAMGAFIQMHKLPDAVQQQVEGAMLEKFGEDVWEVTALDLQLPKLGLPTLIFHDKKDEVTPYISSLALKRAYPAAELMTTEGLGHRRILRDPDVVRRAVEFIAD